jgi:hypothetical protein
LVNRINIRSNTGEQKGWIKEDSLQSNKINVYDKYRNKKGWLQKDSLKQDELKFERK